MVQIANSGKSRWKQSHKTAAVTLNGDFTILASFIILDIEVFFEVKDLNSVYAAIFLGILPIYYLFADWLKRKITPKV